MSAHPRRCQGARAPDSGGLSRAERNLIRYETTFLAMPPLQQDACMLSPSSPWLRCPGMRPPHTPGPQARDPSQCPSMDTTRVSASTPRSPMRSPWRPPARPPPPSAPAGTGPAYCARKVRASAATWSGSPPPRPPGRGIGRAPSGLLGRHAGGGGKHGDGLRISSRSMIRDGSVNPSRCARSPPPATAPVATVAAVRVSPPSAPKRPERPRLIPWPINQSRNTEPSVQTERHG